MSLWVGRCPSASIWLDDACLCVFVCFASSFGSFPLMGFFSSRVVL